MHITCPLLLLAAVPLPRQAHPAAAPAPLRELWSLPLGEGYSSVAAHRDGVVASYREPGSSETRVVSVDAGSGAVRWRTAFPDPAREGQEDYGGGRGPHATPLVQRGTVYVLGYGGRLVALDAADGEQRWSVDLVDELGAKPVQFGFAAAPVALEDRVFVVTGGASGVTAFVAGTGAVAWRSPAFDASYVTPVLARVAGVLQLVCVTEDETLGLDPATGVELWKVAHARADLTNYAMLVALEGGGFLVSGQGNRGARRIDVVREPGGWSASVSWHARAVQFSHGRVLEQGGLVFGSNGSLLCAVGSAEGSLVFKQRGFVESSVVEAGDWAVRVDEEGELTLLRLSPERIDVHARRRVLEPRAWAAPVALGERLFLRDGARLVCLRLPSLDELPGPIESFDTGYRAGAVRVVPALIAFAHGSYETPDGRVLELAASRGELTLRLPHADAPLVLVPRSERTFEADGEGLLELVSDDGVVPSSVEWRAGEQLLRARRKDPALEPVEGELRAGLAGLWRVAGAIDLELVEGQTGFEATSSAYRDVRFAVAAESADRVWLRALDAPYGIPDILIEVGEERLTIHQGSETVSAVRP